MILKTCYKCNKVVEKYKPHKCITDERKKFCNKCKMFYYISKPHVCLDGEVVKHTSNDLKSYRWIKKVRPMIIRRDGGYCQRCLVKYGVVNGENITVHHIKSREHYPELTWEESNLITLCMKCNNKLGISDKLDFEWKPKEYQPFSGE